MPDLTIECMRVCESNRLFEAEVTGSRGDKYHVRFSLLGPYEQDVQGCMYGWECSCPDFQRRRRHTPGGKCKHIKMVEPYRCGWHEQFGGDWTPPKHNPRVKILTGSCPDPDSPLEPCPCCGGGVTVERCAV